MIDPVAFQIGPVAVRWYGIIIDTAFIAGTLLAYYHAVKSNVRTDHLLNLIILIIPSALIGARLYYVIFNWHEYVYSPLEALAIWHGGLAIHGGLLGSTLAGYFYIRKHKLDFWQYADVFAPSVILGQALGRWGNFINQEAYGTPVTRDFISHFPAFIQKQMFIQGQYRHPTFLYESAWDFLVFLFLLFFFRRKRFPGQIMLLYLALYSLGRFFIEGLRTDSEMLGPIRLAQLVSLILITLSFFIYYKKTTAKNQT
ncbi:Prolipoprotein diacylglyceryl transferase [Pelotomaculum propionicicum]|uniref:Phosphatidylglycerol--prolipoprotein diacylglyceryl transferase n=1 Tax=Pelotomaculum propionicicum TaxID=258475 RepID=A0A4Y7RPW6_9FIRM|nr:Prolipoprotein diacylglyceryl transferase [Pelotomaculum propionicicum]